MAAGDLALQVQALASREVWFLLQTELGGSPSFIERCQLALLLSAQQRVMAHLFHIDVDSVVGPRASGCHVFSPV
jgi:hypothetical protein